MVCLFISCKRVLDSGWGTLFQEIDEKMIVFSQKMKKKQPARVPYWNEKLMEFIGNKVNLK